MAKRKRIDPSDRGMVEKMTDRLMLTWRLMIDGRVNLANKVIPLMGFLYLISPLDVVPEIALGPFGLVDDAAILLMALEFFIRSAPSEVVRAHLKDLQGQVGSSEDKGFGTGDVIDGEYQVEDKPKRH